MFDSSRYGFKDFPGSSHWLLIRAIRRTPHRREGALLDVGAAGGELASYLRDDFGTLIGIEGDPGRIEALSRCYDSAFIADLTRIHRLPQATDVVLADVLEHLPSPHDFLDLVRDSIAPGGRLYLSVPNVANITTRLSLFFGRWDYADRGILDRTHLRFYTRKTILAELENSGFAPVRIEATTMPIRLVLEGVVPEFLLRPIERILLPATRIFPRLLGYQWVITSE